MPRRTTFATLLTLATLGAPALLAAGFPTDNPTWNAEARAVGTSWTYDVEETEGSGSPDTYTQTTTIDRTETLNGSQTKVYRVEAPGNFINESFFFEAEGALTVLRIVQNDLDGSEDAQFDSQSTLTPFPGIFFIPLFLFDYTNPVDQGNVTVSSSLINGSGTVTVTVEDFSPTTVTVPAGTFDVQHFEVVTEANIGVFGQEERITYWSNPEIGPVQVRRESSTTAVGAPVRSSVQTIRLRASSLLGGNDLEAILARLTGTELTSGPDPNGDGVTDVADYLMEAQNV